MSIALIAGIAGPTPVDGVLDTAKVLRQLGDFYRPEVDAKPVSTGADLKRALKAWQAVPQDQTIWLILIGDVFLDEFDDPTLRTHEEQGLAVDTLIRGLRKAHPERICLLIDTPAEGAGLLRSLKWPTLRLRVISPGTSPRLADLLLPNVPGPITTADLAAALSGLTHDPKHTLNQRTEGDPTARPDEAGTFAYLRGLRSEHSALLFDPGMRNSGLGLGLADIYEPVTVRGSQTMRAPKSEETREPDRTALEYLGQHRCLFVVGDPGSGKTTFLKDLVLRLCGQTLHEAEPVPGLPTDALPVWFDLADLKGDPSPQGLLDQALAALACAGRKPPLDRAVAQRALRDGRLVLLLDGLDEVAPAARRLKVAHAATKLAQKQAERCVVLVTCRPAAADAGAVPSGPFTRVDLQPFTDAQIARVTANWMRGRPETAPEAEAIATTLVADLHLNAAVYAQAQNPLALAMICVVLYRQDGGRLPDNRAELYDKLISLLLDDRQKGLEPAPLEHWERRHAITDLAMDWWQASCAQDDAKADTVRPEAHCVATLTQARGHSGADAKRLVRFFDERAGLLVWRGLYQGQRLLRFAHRSFAEYLVACRLTEDTHDQTLDNHALDSNWREIALLYVAELVRRPTGSPDPAWQLIGRLLDQANDAARTWPDRGAYARLAAECLADWRAHAPAELVERLDAQQAVFFDVDTAAQIPAPTRAAFWTAIGPHNQPMQTHSRWVGLPSGTYWRGTAPGDDRARANEKPAGPITLSTAARIHRWPVTVAEFEAFVQTGGYTDSSLWSPEGWAWRTAEEVTSPARWPRPGRAHHPVTTVSYWEAEAWARWATREQAQPGWTIRLPTEAEWEAAARGPHHPGRPVARYPWAGADDPTRRNGWDSRIGEPTPPTAFPGGASPLGTWDQSGNVWEWCTDAPIPYSAGNSHDPVSRGAANSGRVLRGGGFGDVPQDLRVSDRNVWLPSDRDVDFGFRCVSWCVAGPSALDP